MQFLRSVCYNSFQVPHCLIRFFTNRPKSVILFYTEVFFLNLLSRNFLYFELYKELLLSINTIKRLRNARTCINTEYFFIKSNSSSMVYGKIELSRNNKPSTRKELSSYDTTNSILWRIFFKIVKSYN